MLLGFGLAFELPLLMLLLNVAGVLTHQFFRKWRRLIIFGVFVFAGIASPSPDPLTMLLLAGPCVVLVEVAELIIWMNDRRRATRASLYEGLADDELAPLDDAEPVRLRPPVRPSPGLSAGSPRLERMSTPASPAQRYAAFRQRSEDGAELAAFQGLYDFAFDDFQRRACQALAGGHGVLVAAPTGSGKTVIGEFAVHLALAEGRKCFYTTPIKALSNQKYNDLARRYGATRSACSPGTTASTARRRWS